MIKYVPFSLFNAAHVSYYSYIKSSVSSDLKGIVAELEGRVVGMVLFEDWTNTSCQAHIKIDSPMCLRNGGIIAEAVHYVYDHCGREVIYGFIRSDNLKALEFDKKIGFQVEHVLKNAYDVGVDGILISMRAHQCRYYNQTRAA